MSQVIIEEHRGGLLVLSRNSRLIYRLQEELTYTRVTMLRGFKEIQENGGSNRNFQRISCYHPVRQDNATGLVAAAGFLNKIATFCKANNARVFYRHKDPPDKSRLVINRRVLSQYRFRGEQRAVLEKILRASRGRTQWPTGAGKSFLISVICRLFHKAKIVVTVKSLTNVLDLHTAITNEGVGSVGLICSKKSHSLGRVTVVSAGSLHHMFNEPVDILIGDEIHELATDNILQSLAMFSHCRAYGFSANIDDRMDRADFEMEGIFGPVLHRATYDQSVRDKMVTQINVGWFPSGIQPYEDPSRGCRDFEFDKIAVWTNTRRNQRIAEILQQFPDQQILIPVRTLEHACHLKRYLPDYELCYRPSPENTKTVERLQASGVLPEDLMPLTDSRLEEIKNGFEQGTVRKAIATSIWDRGVNFPQLNIIFMADPTSSTVMLTQKGGRLSRLFEGKKVGWILDLEDEFNEVLHGKAGRRKQFYKKQKWKQQRMGRQQPNQ